MTPSKNSIWVTLILLSIAANGGRGLEEGLYRDHQTRYHSNAITFLRNSENQPNFITSVLETSLILLLYNHT